MEICLLDIWDFQSLPFEKYVKLIKQFDIFLSIFSPFIYNYPNAVVGLHTPSKKTKKTDTYPPTYSLVDVPFQFYF